MRNAEERGIRRSRPFCGERTKKRFLRVHFRGDKLKQVLGLTIILSLSSLASAEVKDWDGYWKDWRKRCIEYKKCTFSSSSTGTMYYVVEVDGARLKVKKVDQQAYHSQRFTWQGDETEDDPQIARRLSGPVSPTVRPERADPRPQARQEPERPAEVEQERRDPHPAARRQVQPDPERAEPRAPVRPQVAAPADNEPDDDVPPGTMSGAGCPGLDNRVVQKYEACRKERNVKVNSSCPIALLDAERGKFFVVSQAGKCLMSSPAGIGINSMRGNNAVPGNRGGSKMTPSGLFMTRVHSGARYQAHNSVGINCVSGAECSNTIARGVIIHASRSSTRASSTWGCTSLPVATFRQYHSLVSRGAKQCPFFAYFDEGQCGKRGVPVRGLASTQTPRRGNR